MRTEIVEHTARVLERTAGRGMAIDALYLRVHEEAGLEGGQAGLLERLRAEDARFLVLPPAATLPDEPGCTAAERSVYAAAMAAAGVPAAPTVLLAERLVPEPQSAPTAQPGTGGEALLADLHASVLELLRACGPDAEPVRGLVSGCWASLGAACGRLGDGS